MRLPRLLPALLSVSVLAACAPTQPIVQVPTFQVQSAALSGITLPGGGRTATAFLTLSLRVQNPNPFPLRMSNVAGRFILDGADVGTVNLPDVALPARGEASQRAEVALPITLNSAATFLKVARGQAVSYRLDGSFTTDLGVLGRPTFGPFALVQGVLKQPAILP